MRVAVLDDADGIAERSADWASLGRVDVLFHDDHVTDPDALVMRLSYADVVVLTGERTVLSSDLLERLPGIQLVITMGSDSAVDLDAATELGMTVCATDVLEAAAAETASPEDLAKHYGRACDIVRSFRSGDVILARN
jgi:lactate dehydrogenase-like 2-hydroxyacid dehydrogenase